MILHRINKLKTFIKHRRLLKENKIIVGEDKFGNEYYQTYSNWGLPTKRESDFNDLFTFSIHRDNSYW